MLTMVLVLALGGLLGALVFRLSGTHQPATNRSPTQRGRTVQPRRRPRRDANAAEPVEAVEAAPARAVAVDFDENAVTIPWWRRVTSFLQLVMIIAFVGILTATIVAALALLAGSLLDRTIS